MNKNILIVLAVVVGLVLVALTFVYWFTPAGALPFFLPGFVSGSDKVHYTHGLATLILGLALFAYAWFQSGKKSPQP